jgi:hypothetical protein
MSALEDRLIAQIRYAGLKTPVREHRFAPPRRWRFDLAWPDRMLACECEGGVWTGGRHTRGNGFEGDCAKYSSAALMGWRVLRCTAGQVKSGVALQWVERGLSGDGAPQNTPSDGQVGAGRVFGLEDVG